MVKLLAIVSLLVNFAGCAGVRPSVDASILSLGTSENPTEVRKLWTQKLDELITDLNVSRNGEAILVATAPNPEIEPSGFRHHLLRFDRHGKLAWKIELQDAVRSQSLSDDGSLAFVSTYDNALMAIDVQGHVLWTVEEMCRPVPLGKSHRFVCYHDDDAGPEVAFDVYSEKGKKLLFYPIAHDVLALKVSDDGRNTAIALTGGQVILFDSEFRSPWQRKVEGEILDLSVSAGPSPRVAALFNISESSSERIALFDAQGARLASAEPASHVEQIELVPDGTGALVYGNGARGQYLGYFEMPLSLSAPAKGEKPKQVPEKWRRGDDRFADYSSSAVVAKDLVIVGFEEVAANARQSHLLAFDLAGHLKWNIRLLTEEGAYLYAQGFAPESSLLVVGTDDGYLSAFK